METKDITISINIKQGSIRFIKNSTNSGARAFTTDDTDRSEVDNVRIELGIAKVFHKVLNLIKADPELFQKEDFELLGEMLSRILFGKANNESDVRNYIMQETEQTLTLNNADAKQICRIYLEFDVTSGVAMLPWEYTLYKTRTTDSKAKSLYLSANTSCRFQLLRRVMNNPVRHIKAERLFVIVILNLGGNDQTDPPIDPRTTERKDVMDLFTSLQQAHPDTLSIRFIERVTYENLKSEIENIYRSWKQEYQGDPCYAIHYVGHSILYNQVGKLVMDFDKKGPGWLEDRKFAALFSTEILKVPQPSLVSFQSCDSAKIGSINNELRGVAYEMTQINIPCVVGMQNEINLETSCAFFEQFYGSILDGSDVGVAVTCGRDHLGREYKIRVAYTNNSFGSPVLFITTEEPVQLLQPVQREQLIEVIDTNGKERESVLRQFASPLSEKHAYAADADPTGGDQRAATIQIRRQAANVGQHDPQLPLENETKTPNQP